MSASRVYIYTTHVYARCNPPLDSTSVDAELEDSLMCVHLMNASSCLVNRLLIQSQELLELIFSHLAPDMIWRVLAAVCSLAQRTSTYGHLTTHDSWTFEVITENHSPPTTTLLIHRSHLSRHSNNERTLNAPRGDSQDISPLSALIHDTRYGSPSLSRM